MPEEQNLWRGSGVGTYPLGVAFGKGCRVADGKGILDWTGGDVSVSALVDWNGVDSDNGQGEGEERFVQHFEEGLKRDLRGYSKASNDEG